MFDWCAALVVIALCAYSWCVLLFFVFATRYMLCGCCMLQASKGLQGVVGMSATHPTWQKTRPDDDNDQ